MADEQKPTGKVVIAGGSGFLGLGLARYLAERGGETNKSEVVLISRNPPAEQGPWTHVCWDGRSVDKWVDQLDGATALVNLVGRTVDCIKTPDHCDEILRSRVEATNVLGQAMRAVETPPDVWVQMSTAHIHGDPPEVVCDENSAFGYGLAPFVAKSWEEAYEKAVLPETRQVIMRTSFVLGRSGGALQRLVKLTRCGLGGTVGHGKQGISWIHQDDLNRLFARAIVSADMQGAYMITAPNPVSNAKFMRELRRVLRIPIGLPATEWMARIGAPLVMRTDPELALYGRYCVSTRLAGEGFQFHFPELPTALDDLFKLNDRP